jgi:acetyl/propionyl-CoA carboxylase alpha subunit
LLAKLICWGQDREQAIARMRRAIEEYTIAGVRTTLPFTAWILRHPRFISGDVSTDFIAEEWRPDELEQMASTISTENGALTPETIAALASALAAQDQGAAAVAQRGSAGENGADGSRWRTAGRRDGVLRGR